MSTDETLRRALIVLAALGIAGTTTELVMLQHWGSLAQMIPWVALAVMSWCVWKLVRSPSPKTVKLIRAGAATSGVAAGYGVIQHVTANYDSGPLDRHYAAIWGSMPLVARWWAASIHAVGPAPTLAPAVLAQIALCIAFATIHHPAMNGARFTVTSKPLLRKFTGQVGQIKVDAKLKQGSDQ